MANEVATNKPFGGMQPSRAFTAHIPPGQQDSLADGIGSSYGVLKYKGKVWTLQYQGGQHIIVRPDDGTPSPVINVLILKSNDHKSRSYYEAYNEDSSQGARPICASSDGIAPDRDVAQKQCDSCALCPRSVWKTDANKRKFRECSEYKRLAVFLLPAQSKQALGAPLLEPVFLRVPAGSLTALSATGLDMERQGWHYTQYVMQIGFDPLAAHPKMTFKPLQGLTDKDAPALAPLFTDPLVARILGDTTAALEGPKTVMQQPQDTGIAEAMAAASGQTAAVGTGPAPQATPVRVPPPNPPANQSIMGLGDQSVVDVAPETASIMDTGPVTVAKPAAQTAADVGAMTESDASLDALIKDLI